MSARKYDFLTRVCFLIAILSSVVYGKLGAFDWLALSVGATSAVIAAATYFYNAGGLEAAEESAAQPGYGKTDILAAGDVAVAISVPPFAERAYASPSATHKEIVRVTEREEVQTTLWANLVEPARRNRHVILAYYKQVKEVPLQTAELRQRQLFLDEITQLVERYSPTCEIEVSLADGHLTIKPARPTRPAHIKTREEREENEFKLSSSLAPGLPN